jgi:hypothetical protein
MPLLNFNIPLLLTQIKYKCFLSFPFYYVGIYIYIYIYIYQVIVWKYFFMIYTYRIYI